MWWQALMYVIVWFSGFTFGLCVFDWMFFTPLRKLLREAMDGWGGTLESLKESAKLISDMREHFPQVAPNPRKELYESRN